MKYADIMHLSRYYLPAKVKTAPSVKIVRNLERRFNEREIQIEQMTKYEERYGSGEQSP